MANVRAIYCRERCLPDITGVYPYLLIRISKVYFRPIPSSGHILSDLVLIGEGCHILNGVFIPLTSVHYGPKTAILFRNAQHRRSLVGEHGLPPACLMITLNFFSQRWLERIWTTRHIICIPLVFIYERYFVIYRS